MSVGRRMVPLAVLACAVAVPAAPAAARSHHHRVLRVGRYHHIKGNFRTIQGAVDHAHRGDWILIGPGDYHERGDRKHRPSGKEGTFPASGVLIRKARLHLRGMKRNRVIVDGGKRGASPCSRKRSGQDFGLRQGHHRIGRNGIVVWKTNHVSIQNLTVCNFLSGSDGGGNEVWFNGGDGSGKIGLGAFRAAYVTTTATWYRNDKHAGTYGLFSSNASGPGHFSHTYASNFNDGGYYIGACRQVCDQEVDHAWSQFNALGYSGTNAGGSITIRNSEFDHNKDGFDTNSQNNDDFPSPQDGSCPGGGTSPVTNTVSCWVFIDNYVHDNNNPNVPAAGAAAQGPVGTGVSISGGRFDTIMRNRFVNNGAWGVLLVPYPDNETPPPGENCQGGSTTGPGAALGFKCTFDDWGNQLFDNTFVNNGFFGNPTNGDIGELTLENGHPINCYKGNSTPDGTSPSLLQTTNSTCGRKGLADGNGTLLAEAACDTQVVPQLCSPSDHYPRQTHVYMHHLPRHKLHSMPHPCRGVPHNPWCPRRKKS